MPENKLSPSAFRQLQSDLGLTNAECAQVLGVTLHAVEQWRSGRRPVPGPAAVALELLKSNRQLELALDIHIEKVKELAAGAGEWAALQAAARGVIAARFAGHGLEEAINRLAQLLDQ